MYTNIMNTETKRRIAASAVGFALPRYDELPGVGLYLDQTVQYVNAHFRAFPGVELTGSMVSNYVKKGLISHPVRKKYTRDQIGYLIYIVAVKNVLSMENIQLLFSIQQEYCSAETAYNTFCAELEAAACYVFGLRSFDRPADSELNDEQYLLRRTIIPAAHKLYLDCCFDALRQEKALWPDILDDLN